MCKWADGNLTLSGWTGEKKKTQHPNIKPSWYQVFSTLTLFCMALDKNSKSGISVLSIYGGIWASYLPWVVVYSSFLRMRWLLKEFQVVFVCLARDRYSVQLYLMSLCFAVFHFTDNGFFVFKQIEGLWQSYNKQVCQHHFSSSIHSLRVSGSHFGNSYNISNFFITIIIFIMVTCDQWSLMLLLQKDNLLKAQMMVNIFSNKVLLN